MTLSEENGKKKEGRKDNSGGFGVFCLVLVCWGFFAFCQASPHSEKMV